MTRENGGATEGTSAGRRSGVGYAPHRRSTSRHRSVRLVRRFHEKATVLAYRACSWLLGHLPERPVVAIAQLAFLAGGALWPAKRRAIGANAAHVLGVPEGDRRAAGLARAAYRAYARYIVGLMRLPALPPSVPASLVDVSGEHGLASFQRLYERLRSEGRAMLIVTLHVGSMETLAAAMAKHGFPAYGVADDSAFPELYELLAAQRRRWGVEVIAWRNLREIHRVLREGGILALLVDWGYRPDGIPVRFFGDWTTLPAGPAALAAKSGAAIVPVVNRRLPDGRYRAEHGEPIEVAGGSPASIQQATQAVADALEAAIRKAPEQWYCFKPIWPDDPAEARELEERAKRARAATEERPARRRERAAEAREGGEAQAGGAEPGGAQPDGQDVGAEAIDVAAADQGRTRD